MKRKKQIIVIFCLLSLLLIGNSSGQNIDRIYADFRQLELYMVKVWALVKQFDNKKAVGLMILAKSEFDKARDLLYRDQPGLWTAKIHLEKARQYTNLAARLILSRPFLNLKSQLDDLINRAENVVSMSNSDEAHYLLNQAKKFRRLSYTAFKANRIKQGEESYRISFFFARKCLDFLKNSGLDLAEQYENLEISVDQLLTQAEELLGDRKINQLDNLVREAKNHFEEAKVMAEEGKIQRAISRLQLIKRLLYRVFDQREKGIMSDVDRLKNHFYTLRTFLESLDQEINQLSDPRVKVLLDKSWQFFRNGERSYEGGNYAKARGDISLSQRFANKVFRMTKSNQTLQVDELKDQLNETRSLLILQNGRVQDSGNKAVLKLYTDAERMLLHANQALDNKKPGVAFQLIQAATRMSARIQRELRESSQQPDLAALERKYLQVINSITNLEDNQEISGKFQPVLKQLRRFAEQGKTSLDNSNYVLADEYFNTALEQINQYIDNWRK